MSFENIWTDLPVATAWIDAIYSKAKHKDFVSIDIFDTALTRDVDSPHDIFARVEKALVLNNLAFKGFASARKKAEQAARDFVYVDKGYEEITLDEIYTFMPKFIKLAESGLAHAKQQELAEEEQALFAVPDILALTKKLTEEGKAWGFVSDMYLPREFLQRILIQRGYSDFHFLIVSSEYRKTKASGNIWKLKELSGKNILHIGDNKKADISKPQKYGIATEYYGRASSHMRSGYKLSPEVLPFSTAYRHAEIILSPPPQKSLSVLTDSDINDASVMYALGSTFGTLMVGAFTLWLAERTKIHGITHLAFCARDGYLIQKAWHIFNKRQDLNVTDSYLYVSRKVLTLGTAYLESTSDQLSPTILNFLTNYGRNAKVADVLAILSELNPELAKIAAQRLGRKNSYIRRHGSIKVLRNILQDESSLVYEALGKCNRDIISYFMQEGVAGQRRLGIVDMGWNGTMQRGITQLCRQINPEFSCVGFYYGLWNTATGNFYQAGPMESAFFTPFDSVEDMQKNWQGIDILEEVHTAPEGTTSGFQFINNKWRPMLSESEEERRQFENSVAPFQQGILDSLKAIATSGKTKSGLTKEDLTPENAISAYRLIFLSPDKTQLNTLSKISHGRNFDHLFESLYCPNIPFLTKNRKREIHQASWKVGLMMQWLEKASSRQKRHLRRLIATEFAFLSEAERTIFK